LVRLVLRNQGGYRRLLRHPRAGEKILPSREDDPPGAVEDASCVTANHNSIREI
jgi:hypothetical protein